MMNGAQEGHKQWSTEAERTVSEAGLGFLEMKKKDVPTTENAVRQLGGFIKMRVSKIAELGF